MASLRQVIRDNRYEICNNIAWVAIYKDGRSWMAEAFYPEDGDYENGYVFDAYDYGRMKEIVDTDHKAICINGDHMGGFEDFALEELENKILWFYESRYHQLQQDFLECFVVPPEVAKESQESIDSIISDAAGKSEEICGKKKSNEYYKMSDGFFNFYVNVETGVKKFRLDKDDVCVERSLDDFCR